MKTRSFYIRNGYSRNFSYLNNKNKVSKPRLDYTFIKKMIKNNEYIKNYTSNKLRHHDSLSYLVDTSKILSQSDCIKLGICVEKILSEIILDKNKDLKNIRPVNTKGKHERDHLFINEKTKNIFYSELKSNLNLDTEKCAATVNKCKNIVSELETEYPDYSLKWCLLGLRYTESSKINKTIMNKYTSIKENVFGVNEYMKILGTDIHFTEKDYTFFINEIVKKFNK